MVSHPGRPESLEARGYRIFGRVQGVGFRQWACRTAGRLGISGSVRNLPDGSVEVLAHGSRDGLTELELALRTGPIAARVERIESFPTAAYAPGEGFRVIS